MIYIITIIAVIVLGVAIHNHLTGRRLIRDFLHYQKIKRIKLSTLDDRWNESADRSDIIISFSTIPERIDHIEYTVKSLLYQKRMPMKILLNVPYISFRGGEEYIIPDWLKQLKSLEIVRVDKDFGPATKFIPTLESQKKDQPILVLDDDHLYPPTYVKDFEKATKKYPDFILAANGWLVPKDLTDRPTTLIMNLFHIPPTPVKGTRTRKIRQTDIIQGYAGYLIKPRFFHVEQLKDYSNVPEELQYVDDVWISANALAPKYVIPTKRYCYNPFLTRDFFSSNSLANINNRGNSDSEGHVKNEDRYNSIAIKFYKGNWLNA